MSTKQVFLALALVTVLGLAAPRAQAQVVGGGGYVGFGTPGFGGAVSFGTPVIGAAVIGAPVVPYVAPYPVVVPRQSTAHLFTGPAGGAMGPAITVPRYYHGRRLWLSPVVRCLSWRGHRPELPADSLSLQTIPYAAMSETSSNCWKTITPAGK